MTRWVLYVGDLFKGLQVVSIEAETKIGGSTICTPKLSDGTYRLAWYGPCQYPNTWLIPDDEKEEVLKHAQKMLSIMAVAEEALCYLVVTGIARDGRQFEFTSYFGHSGQRYADHLEYKAGAAA